MKKNTNRLSIFLLCMGFLLVTFATNLTLAQPPQPSFQDDDGDDEPEPGDKKKNKGKKKKPTKKKKKTTKKKKKKNDDDTDDGGDTTDSGSNDGSSAADAGVADSRSEKSTEKTPDTSSEASPDGGASERRGEAPPREVSDAGSEITPEKKPGEPASEGNTPDQTKPEGAADGGAARTQPTPPTDTPSNTNQINNEVVMLTPQTQLFWELRLVWVVVALLLLSWLLLLFHSMLPLQGLRFLSLGSHGLLRLGAAVLFLVLLYRMLQTASLPGGTEYTGLLLFSFVALETHIQKKKSFPTVFFGAFTLLPVAIGGILWALSQPISANASFMHPSHQSPYFSWGLTLMYVAFGILATAGSWLFASGYLGLLAKRNKGTGYGLAPDAWNQLQLQPGMMTLIAFPILTLAWIFQVLWSLDAYGSPWQAWTTIPRLWTVIFCWIFIAAYLFSMRFPRRTADPDAPLLIYGENAVLPTNRFPSFLLLIATVGSAALYVGANFIIKLLQ